MATDEDVLGRFQRAWDDGAFIGIEQWSKLAKDLAAALREARAERDADKKRLDWIGPNEAALSTKEAAWVVRRTRDFALLGTGDTIREAIDAAMSRSDD